MTIVLRHLAGSREGTEQTLDLPPGGVITLGRLPDCDVPFDPHQDLAASGRHARIGCDHGELWLEDLDSSNGTFLSGQRIQSRVRLDPGAVVELGRGGPRFIVTRPGEPDIPRTAAVGAIPPAEGDGRVGAHTVALMIGKAQTQASRKFTAVIAALAVLVLAAVAVIVVLALRGEARDEEQQSALARTREELDRTRTELSTTRTELEDARKAMEDRVKTERNKQTAHALTARLQQRKLLEEDLEHVRVEVTEEIRTEFAQRQKELVDSLTSVETNLSQRYGSALYMLTYEPDPTVMREQFDAQPPRDRPGLESGFCTAFAVTPDGWLATNAHCVDAIFETRWRFARMDVPVRFFAKRNGDSSTAYPILIDTAVLHPGYLHYASPDVGLLKVDLAAAGKSQLDNHVFLATESQYHALNVGQPIYMLGFPGKVMDPYRVVADFRGGNVARLTNFESEISDVEQTQFVWHTALTSAGTSGSPIFDRFGHVVAVNNGGLGLQRVVTSNGVSQEVTVIYSADGLNFGIRADLLRELAARHAITLPTPAEALSSMDDDAPPPTPETTGEPLAEPTTPAAAEDASPPIAAQETTTPIAEDPTLPTGE